MEDDDLLHQDDPKDVYNWTRAIKKLMNDFENVYTDISFTLTNSKTHDPILKDMANPVFNSRILFGTDFFLTAPYGSDKKLTEKFFGPLLPYRQQLTETNPVKFLTSDFFTQSS
jgi:predicted TIM-barrel fold metal-dependent hydrolase